MVRRGGRSMPACPTTTRAFAIDAASASSLEGIAFSFSRTSSSRVGKVLAIREGDTRSGSANHDIEADHDGAVGDQSINQLRHQGPWPRPLAELVQAIFVQIDDHDRPFRRDLARLQASGKNRRSGPRPLGAPPDWSREEPATKIRRRYRPDGPVPICRRHHDQRKARHLRGLMAIPYPPRCLECPILKPP